MRERHKDERERERKTDKARKGDKKRDRSIVIKRQRLSYID